ncbi:MAG TPA: response regulator, partial [Rectinemataceae bacterium]
EAGGLQWRVYAVPALGWSGSDPYLYVLLGSGIMAAFFLFIALRRVGMRSAEEGIPTPEPGRRARPKNPLEDLLAAAYSKPPESGEGVAAGSPPDPHPDEPREKPETGGTTAPDQAVRRSASPNLHDTRTLSPSLFPDLALVEKKRGRPITFKGPAVKGDLFMPEHSGESAHTAPIQAAREQAEFPAAAHAPAEPQIPAPEPKPNPSRIQAQRLSQQDFFFSLEETTSPRSLPILVVDDSEANRDIVGRMLSLRGYSADFADSGEAALDMYVGKHYALVLVDTFMPGMDGYKTAAELRKARPGSKTLVAGMSARTGQAELEKCKAAGMDELLVKPFTLNQLIAIVEKARN